MHVEPIVARAGHRQADAVDRDRPFGTMYGARSRRKTDRQPVELRLGPPVLDAADPVDVSLNEVSAEPAVGAQRPLEIHARARREPSERRDPQRLGADVGAKSRSPSIDGP